MRQRYLWKALILLAIIPILANGQTVYQISDGENKIDSLLFYNVQAGDIIELTSNGGYYYEWFPAEISIPLTIRAKAGLEVKPIWYCDDDAKMIVVYDDLTLEGIRFDGSLGMNPTDRCLITDSTGTGTGTKLDYHLTIENCEFVNFDRVIYGQPYTQADTVLISNSWFAHIGERAIYYKDPELDPGSVKHFFLENSTFWDIGEDVIYVGDHDANSETPGPEFVVNHVTVHDPGMADAGIKTIYPKYLDGALIKNSMVTRSELNVSTTPARIYGANSAVLKFLDWNTDDVSLQAGADMDDTTGTNYLENIDPLYADTTNVGDFRLFSNSPAFGFGEGGTTLGDQRWDGYRGIGIDGFLSDWPEWTKIGEKTENDPAMNDTTELKAFWFSYDSTKIALRVDFFGQCDWRGGTTAGDWNYNSGAMRIYFKDPLGNKYRIRLYQNSMDQSYTNAKLLLEEGPDFPGINSGRETAMAQWNEAGTSFEVFFPSDSLAVPVSQWDPDSTIQARMYVLAGWGGYDNKLPPEGNYYWFTLSDVDPIVPPPVSIGDDGFDGSLPLSFQLNQNFPNPFNPVTAISYYLPANSEVALTIYNIVGQKIATLVDEKKLKGNYEIQWGGADDLGRQVASGIYFFRLEAKRSDQLLSYTNTKKMILLK